MTWVQYPEPIWWTERNNFSREGRGDTLHDSFIQFILELITSQCLSPALPPPPAGHPPALPLLGSTMEDGTQFWSLLTSLKCHPLYDLFEVKANHGDRKSYLVLKRDELWGNGKTKKWENEEKNGRAGYILYESSYMKFWENLWRWGELRRLVGELWKWRGEAIEW